MSANDWDPLNANAYQVKDKDVSEESTGYGQILLAYLRNNTGQFPVGNI